MKPSSASAKVKPYLTIKAAARLLGVSASTLRNWDRQGKLRAQRHPVNGYRLYNMSLLEGLRLDAPDHFALELLGQPPFEADANIVGDIGSVIVPYESARTEESLRALHTVSKRLTRSAALGEVRMNELKQRISELSERIRTLARFPLASARQRGPAHA